MKKRQTILAIGMMLVIGCFCACGAQERPVGAEAVAETETKKAGRKEYTSEEAGADTEPAGSASFLNMEIDCRMELEYADQFTVDVYKNGCFMITITESGQFLVVPEGTGTIEDVPEEVTVLYQPIENIYLVATSAMDLFRCLDGIGQIRFSGSKVESWYIEEAREAMERGDMVYAGKYSAPDYELILSEGCGLAVESTMIYHSPKVKEQLEEMGIPVLVERSSYESHPLGRLEWIKLYGVLLGKTKQAEAFWETELSEISDILVQESTGKTVAYFAINANGSVTVRKSGDYITKMIELAGGQYIFADLGDDSNALSTVNMQMEAFYAGAIDADYLIYNSTMAGELESLQDLLDMSDLMQDFKAVKEGNVWCTYQNMFQESTQIGTMISDMHTMLTDGGAENMRYLYRLE